MRRRQGAGCGGGRGGWLGALGRGGAWEVRSPCRRLSVFHLPRAGMPLSRASPLSLPSPFSCSLALFLSCAPTLCGWVQGLCHVSYCKPFLGISAEIAGTGFKWHGWQKLVTDPTLCLCLPPPLLIDRSGVRATPREHTLTHHARVLAQPVCVQRAHTRMPSSVSPASTRAHSHMQTRAHMPHQVEMFVPLALNSRLRLIK